MYNIDDKKRIVIKVGTSTLTHKSGRQVTLVSSGAIGLGMGKMGMQNRPDETPLKQACAAVGQCELMYIYDKLFGNYNITVAQILLTKYILDTPRKNNVVNTFEQLFARGVIPVVNENDTVAIDELELEFGENDTLAAHVAQFSNSDMLIILSDIDGFYDANPKIDPNAKLIPMVTEINDDIRKLAGDAVSGLGTGGMITKINAAEMAMNAGIDMAILNGRNPDILYDLFDGKQVGTIFTANK